ncbi:SRPBCC family protein [Alteromonas sp. ASW11-130]|uniref:SRPBCC family protein n=1 Tax=Alteromonas sp. ASW11-130 TaxID=3015775 RepID=UPI0022423A1E|nr:SRPBCC family protein [Alteromonas sp. ASW11-130]MCW8091869.1 SRPBCC family protein [Alteromonas sp. ASW11-130]
MPLIAKRTIDIAESRDAVWRIVSDIRNAASVISGIKNIEILEASDASSIIGTKWKETREWMGRDAIEVMWITDASAPSFYESRAESHGSIYVSRIELELTPGGTRLSMSFSCNPQTFMARIMWMLTGWMAKTSLRKIIDQDLEDIKVAAESAAIGRSGA